MRLVAAVTTPWKTKTPIRRPTGTTGDRTYKMQYKMFQACLNQPVRFAKLRQGLPASSVSTFSLETGNLVQLGQDTCSWSRVGAGKCVSLILFPSALVAFNLNHRAYYSGRQNLPTHLNFHNPVVSELGWVPDPGLPCRDPTPYLGSDWSSWNPSAAWQLPIRP